MAFELHQMGVDHRSPLFPPPSPLTRLKWNVAVAVPRISLLHLHSVLSIGPLTQL